MKTHKHYHNHSLLNGGKDVWILSSNWALVCNNVRETIASSLTCIFMQTFVQQFRIGLFLLSKPRCSVCDAPSWPGRLWTDQLARLKHIASMYWKGADNIFVLASWYTSLFSWENECRFVSVMSQKHVFHCEIENISIHLIISCFNHMTSKYRATRHNLFFFFFFKERCCCLCTQG